jgi:hypothetical protein
MSTNKIFCLGDGFAHGHIWPEWPQIVQALLPQYEIVLISGIGAGNEFLINGLLEVDTLIKNQTVVFQWADAARFDKLVQDDDWTNLAKSDPVYHFNFYQRNNKNWWLSSASSNAQVKEYHNFYVQNNQAQLRLQNQKTLISHYLQNNHCNYYFTSTHEQIEFGNSSRFDQLKSNEIQPTPLEHFYFVIEVILPAVDISCSEARIDKLKKRIVDQTWTAYNPDRAEIWQKISAI